MRRLFLAVACLATLAACSPSADLPQAEAAVSVFHQKINSGDFDGIYSAATPQLRAASSRDDFDKLMAAIHRKLGAFQSGSSAGWNDSVTTSGHLLTINYAAKYDRGSANENFVYRLDGDKAVLIGYHINSNALIVN